MPRIVPVTGKPDVPAEHHRVVDAVVEAFGGVRGPFSMLLHSPALAERLLPLVKFFREESVVDAPLRSIAILTAVREREAAYVWAAQVGAARRNGLREAVIDLIRAKGDPASLPAEERDIVIYVRQLMRTNRVDSRGLRGAQQAPQPAVDGRADGGGQLLRPALGGRQRVRGRRPGRRRSLAGLRGARVMRLQGKVVAITGGRARHRAGDGAPLRGRGRDGGARRHAGPGGGDRREGDRRAGWPGDRGRRGRRRRRPGAGLRGPDRRRLRPAGRDVRQRRHRPRSTVPGSPEGQWDRVLRVNLTGVFLCCQIAARQMVRQGGGGASSPPRRSTASAGSRTSWATTWPRPA